MLILSESKGRLSWMGLTQSRVTQKRLRLEVKGILLLALEK